MIRIAPRAAFAKLRTNQLGKLGKLFPTTYAPPRWVAKSHAQTSCERFSQLPPLRPAGLRSATQHPVVNEKSFHNFPNLNFVSQFRVLPHLSSCGGETHPLRGWGRAPQAGSPNPTPRGSRARGASGWSRAPPDPRSIAGRRRPVPPSSSRRRPPPRQTPITETIMASTTLTLPATMTSHRGETIARLWPRNHPRARPRHHHRLGAADRRRRYHQRHGVVPPEPLRRRRHALPALPRLARQHGRGRRRHRRQSTTRKCADTPALMRHTSMAVCSPR